jgi:purine-nucleoside phosphorylase
MKLIDSQLKQQVDEAVTTVLRHRIWQPQVAIVLGSGLGGLGDCLKHRASIPYCDIPHFCPTHANGHAGQLLTGYLSGVPVILLQGRPHRYEGIANHHSGFPIRCLHALGAKLLITTNAAGGLNPRFCAGDLMVIDSHIDFLWARRMWGQPPATEQLAPSRVPPYDWKLIESVKSIARRQDVGLHQGCYLATLGPTYETRSEYRMFRWTGADAVGMSTIPEVLTARSLGMQVLAFSVITNVASTDVPQSTTHAEVVASGKAAGPRLLSIIEQVLDELAGQPD